MKNHPGKTPLLLLIIMPIVFALPSWADETIKIGIRDANKTLEYQNSAGEPAGQLVEIFTLWGEQNEQSIEFIPYNDETLAELLLKGQIDIVANSTPKSELFVSEPYLVYDYYLIARKQKYLETLEDIPLRVGILERDSFLAQMFQNEFQFSRFQNYNEILEAMNFGKVDFILANDTSLNYSVFNVELIKLHYPDKPFYSHPVTAGSRVHQSALIDTFNAGMHRLSRDRIEKIKQKWILSTIGFKLPWAFIGFASFVLVASIGIAVSWLWNKKLEHKIREQTLEIELQKQALEEDIERRIDVEEELQRAKQSADASTKAKSDFLSTMTHELRTPLIGVLGMNELLLETALDNHQRELANTVQMSGETLLELVNNILDFSKIESGNFSLKTASVSITDIVEKSVAIFSHRAGQSGLDITCTIASSARRMVSADPLRLRQILMNLISNAVKFTPHGKIDIRVEMLGHDGKRGTFIFEVEDTGIGMGPEEQLVVFDPFKQIESNRKQALSGTGLGLSIVRQLVEAMDGKIAVKSQPGKGSLFSVTLPLPLAEQPAPEKCCASQAALNLQHNNVSIQGRILVADDFELTRDLVRHFLSAENIDIDEAASGHEVLSLTKNTDYDLILMDCRMPEIDGMETTRLLRERGYSAPIVAMSAHVDSKVYDECKKVGMNDQLSKPFKQADLKAMVSKWLV